MSNKQYIIPIFVPHKGCPHDCIFCNQKKITGQVEETSIESVELKIQEYLKTIPPNIKPDVAFYGGSFTAIDIEVQSKLLKAANKYIQLGFINSIRISTRPDCITQKILDNLKKYGVRVIELGIQSMDDSVLAFSRRGHDSKDVIKAVSLIKENKFILGVQMMIGLPGDNYNKCLQTALSLIDLHPQIARIYPALVVRDTYMEDLYKKKEYKTLELTEAVEMCKNLLIAFEKNNIEVIRIGLQPTDNIQIGKDIVAGPFHPSFRQLVDSLIYKDIMSYLLKNNKCYDVDSVSFRINPSEVSLMIGHKKENINFIKKSFCIRNIQIIQDKFIPEKNIRLEHQSLMKLMSKKDYYNMVELEGIRKFM